MSEGLYMDAPLYPYPSDELAEFDDDGAAADAAFEEPRRWLLHRDTTELLLWWEAYENRHDALVALEHGEYVERAREVLDRHPELTALDALEASRKLIALLEERRWYVIRDAREAGASWTEIGAALGVTKQGAHDWYRRAIAKRAAIDQAHDTERAEQAL